MDLKLFVPSLLLIRKNAKMEEKEKPYYLTPPDKSCMIEMCLNLQVPPGYEMLCKELEPTWSGLSKQVLRGP